MSASSETLQRMIAPWSHLKPHMKRKALFLVSPPVDLMIAARAFHEDQSRVIMAWMESGHIIRPDNDLIAEWSMDLELEFAIVQPFVLVAFKGGEKS